MISSLIKKVILGITGAILTISFHAVQATPILQINSDGNLTGALNVQVGSLGLFNVEFFHDTFSQTFGGSSTSPSSYNFHTETDARYAAQALFDNVFIDQPGGNYTNSTAEGVFDSIPGLTNGCRTDTIYGAHPNFFKMCEALIPYGFDYSLPNLLLPTSKPLLTVSAKNRGVAVGWNDPVQDGDDEIDLRAFRYNYHAELDEVWAKFTPVTTSAPEPTTIALMGLGLAALGMRRRKRIR